MSGYLTANANMGLMMRQQSDTPIDQRGRIHNGWMTPTERQRLPTESLYNVDLLIENIVAGSVVLVSTLAGIEIIRSIAIGGDTTLSIPFYGSSQPVKVIVRKSTATPFYQSFETQTVITSSGASLYVIQISDEN